MRNTKKRIAAILFILVVSAAMIFIFSGNKLRNQDVKAAATDNVAGYAWSENIGWISFNAADEPDF